MATESLIEPGRPNGPAVAWQPGYGAGLDEVARGRELAREDQERIAERGEGRRTSALIEVPSSTSPETAREERRIEYEDKALRNAEWDDRRAAYDREADERHLLDRERSREERADERETRRRELLAERERRLAREPRGWVHHDVHDESTSTLVRDFIGEAQILMSQEIRLAKAEMRQEATNAGKGAANVGVGGVLAFVGLLALVACVIVALAAAMPLWLSALLVGGLALLVGAMIAMGGIAKLKALKPKPERTTETLKEDREWASGLKRDVLSRRRGHA